MRQTFQGGKPELPPGEYAPCPCENRKETTDISSSGRQSIRKREKERERTEREREVLENVDELVAGNSLLLELALLGLQVLQLVRAGLELVLACRRASEEKRIRMARL
jgi:hypothetical protein